MVLPWTTPAPIAAVLSSMDIKALFIWIALVIVDVLILCPFVKSYNKTLLKEEQNNR